MNELTVNKSTGEIIEPSCQVPLDLLIGKLKAYMDPKDKKVFFNGKRYPEIDDWQFVANFYQLKAKTFDPQFVEIDGKKGFRAKAVIVNCDLQEVGSAEAFCMNDEPNWKSRPLFNLASMAQTRAASKAYSNIFRPLMRLAGYEGTPGEEITNDQRTVAMPKAKPLSQELPEDPQVRPVPGDAIEFSEPTKFFKALHAKAREKNISSEKMKAAIRLLYDKSSSKDLTEAETIDLIKQIDKGAVRNG